MQRSNMARYMTWLKTDTELTYGTYSDLWRWSVAELDRFWESVWRFFQVKASKPYERVLGTGAMPGAEWFTGAELNYAEQVFTNRSKTRPAVLYQSELRPMAEMSWAELEEKVAAVAAMLREFGVSRGDRVAAYAPNIPETLIAFLASASLGAIWSSCSPDMGSRSVLDRLQQIEPKVLFATDGYRYAGKDYERRVAIGQIQNSLPSLKRTVLVPYLHPEGTPEGLSSTVLWNDLLRGGGRLSFVQVAFEHPLWVLYSSGTTGVPKAIVHGHGGIVIEHLKFHGFHLDLGPDDRLFWFSTTGWVMWNILVGGLLRGSTIILYDGSPTHPDLGFLWELAERSGTTYFGASAGYLTSCARTQSQPGRDYDLSRVRAIGSTGSPLPDQAFRWTYQSVKDNVWLASTSGGTDVCSGFVGGSPLLPVHSGEIQCRCLGVKAEAFDAIGNSLDGELGELVITKPMPSMPLFFWNDPENHRYRESYFEMYPGVWRHGDWIRFTDRGGAVIYGRSDSTINRKGVRMGTGEIYRVVEEIPEVIDSLAIDLESMEGDSYMPLFVVLKAGVVLDAGLRDRIRTLIRESLNPRYVPDEIFAVAEIPRTLNGKKLEVPVKRILMGVAPRDALSLDSLQNPDSIAYFAELACSARFNVFRSPGAPIHGLRPG